MGLKLDVSQKKSWVFAEFPHDQADLFQEMLRKAVAICSTSNGAREYVSKIVVSHQRNVWIWQVRDCETKTTVICSNRQAVQQLHCDADFFCDAGAA